MRSIADGVDLGTSFAIVAMDAVQSQPSRALIELALYRTSSFGSLQDVG
ncbi:MAG: hypothetical protein KME27_05000 [Lyngbya sp. HA4199-MV5]|nr:hypothetical protein [Lyngbya sp. HA4199-MV5]